MEPREPRPPRPRTEPEPPLQVEGGEIEEDRGQGAAQPSGGMISEGGRSGGGASGDEDRQGGMLGQG